MTIPNDDVIQAALLGLLASAPDGKMHCNDVYSALAKKFPMLSRDELEMPYRNSFSHWANRVQFARLHLVNMGLILPPTTGGGRGYWTLSAARRLG